jgi:hypothetical protein
MTEEPQVNWKNRIVGHDVVDADSLLANPKNWRVHPLVQQKAMVDVLDEVGWVEEPMVNVNTGTLIDGHMRVSEAIKRNQQVPIKLVDLTEKEEDIVLATLDPISAMAVPDKEQVALLAENVFKHNEEMVETLKAMANEGAFPKVGVLREQIRSQILDVLDVSIKDPEHKVDRGEIWKLGRHLLICEDVMRGWGKWIDILGDHAKLGGEILLVPYPGPFVPMSVLAKKVRLVLIQPDKYIAGHILDRYAEAYGERWISKVELEENGRVVGSK